MSLRDILLAISVSAAFGVAFIFIRLGVNEMPPLILTAARYVLAAFPAVLFVARPKVSWRLLALYGVVQGGLMFGLMFTAVALGMPAGLSSIVVQMQVFFTMLIYALLFGERPSRLQLMGAVLAFCGIVIMAEGGQGGVPVLPFLIVIAGAFAWSCANAVSRFARPDTMMGFVVWSSPFAALVLLLASFLLEGERAFLILQPSWTVVFTVIYLAYASTLYAFAMWIQLLNKHGAHKVAPFALLVPVFGLSSNMIFLNEKIPPLAILGGILVLVGLAVNVFGSQIIAWLRR